MRHIVYNSKIMARIRRSRSFKVTEAGTNRQPLCDFLLVVNSNLGHILYRFRDIATKTPKIAVLPPPVSFEGLAWTGPPWTSVTKNSESMPTDRENCSFHVQFCFQTDSAAARSRWFYILNLPSGGNMANLCTICKSLNLQTRRCLCAADGFIFTHFYTL